MLDIFRIGKETSFNAVIRNISVDLDMNTFNERTCNANIELFFTGGNYSELLNMCNKHVKITVEHVEE